ncbi:hypothetical protein ACQBAR_16810 [Propionibacteriaceae bacterium Y1685]
MFRTRIRTAPTALAAMALAVPIALTGCQSPDPEPADDGRVPIDPPSSQPASSQGTDGEQKGTYVTVTATEVMYGGLQSGGDQLVTAQVKVCLTALPPDAEGDTVEVGMDDWSVQTTADGKSAKELEPWSGMEGSPAEGDFDETTLAVGQCAEGKLPFLVTDGVEPQTLEYDGEDEDQFSWPVTRAR